MVFRILGGINVERNTWEHRKMNHTKSQQIDANWRMVESFSNYLLVVVSRMTIPKHVHSISLVYVSLIFKHLL